MSKNYEIIGGYIKDMSSETPDVETYIFVKDYITIINKTLILHQNL